MSGGDLYALLPLMILAATPVVAMVLLAVRRSHALTAGATLAGLTAALVSLALKARTPPGPVTPLVTLDRYGVFFAALTICATIAVVGLSWAYLQRRREQREELYVLLGLGAVGAAVLGAANHFASLFLGLELLSVSLYALLSYTRDRRESIEAGVKYLVLAGASSALLLLGMALVYAQLGTMEFPAIAAGAAQDHGAVLLAGLALILVGAGFKLAAVPFHMWTPDVYQGSPAPVTAFIASVSKGAMLAVLLRFFSLLEVRAYATVVALLSAVAVASMFVGNLLALLQSNVKRLLAYSSIAHMGYMLLAFLAGGPVAMQAVAYYLAAYFVTIIGSFGVVAMLSGPDREADQLEDYRGLAYRRPWVAAAFTAMLLSLAGIPLTAGFIGKFYVLAAGVSAGLWLLVAMLVVNSGIGLFYYLRVVVALYSHPREALPQPAGQAVLAAALPASGGVVLAALVGLLLWLGVYPAPLVALIRAMMSIMR